VVRLLARPFFPGPSAAERLTLAPPTLTELSPATEAQAVITVTLRLGSAGDPTGKEGLSCAARRDDRRRR
jgi:hypothetical protein